MRRQIRFLLWMLALAACAACAARGGGSAADPVVLDQDAALYHGLAPDVPLLAPEIQQRACARFIEAHFTPWERSRPRHSADELFWGLTRFAGKTLYGENTLPRDPRWLDRMRAASQTDAFPNLNRRAIAVTNASLRVLPTDDPAFYAFDRPGEGFPFDYMQNSLVLAGTPLYACQSSADGRWALVECRFAFGWVPVRDIAWVDDGFVRAFRTGVYAAVTRDRLPVTDEAGRFLCTGEIGAILPVLDRRGDGLIVAAPARDADGRAVLRRAALPGDAAAPLPVPATPANFARLANAMLGRPYGWGGLYGDRDCSALTMDLMAPFGVYLPRNSAQQAKTGLRIPLDGLSLREKERVILARSTPFLTLVRKPGHIMLYIGRHDGRPVVLHSLWGLKTGKPGHYGRRIVGRAVVTTLEPGRELPDLARPGGLLLETVTALIVLPGPTDQPPEF